MNQNEFSEIFGQSTLDNFLSNPNGFEIEFESDGLPYEIMPRLNGKSIEISVYDLMFNLQQADLDKFELVISKLSDADLEFCNQFETLRKINDKIGQINDSITEIENYS